MVLFAELYSGKKHPYIIHSNSNTSVVCLGETKPKQLFEYKYMGTNFNPQLTSQKKSNFAIRHFQKKKSNLTIDLSSLGIYAPGPQVLTYRPQILRGLRI